MDNRLAGILVNAIEDNYLDIPNVIPAAIELAFPLPQGLHLDLFNQRGDRPPRNENYFEETIPLYSIGEFKSHFRMSPHTMEVLIQELGNALQEHQHVIPLEKKIHFALWLLCKPESILAAGDRFNFAKSTSHRIYKEVIGAICDCINNHITWPTPARQNEMANIFRARSGGFPGIIGAMDSTHIKIRQPTHNAHDYYNRNKHHSVNLFAVCDENLKFTNVATGFPGRLHDSRVFRITDLYRDLTNNLQQLIPSGEHHIIADCAYPLYPYLMTPYQDNGHLNNAQTNYNTKLSSVRSSIERAFGRLKGKFRRLNLLEQTDLHLISQTIIASCVLHNLIIENDGISDDEYSDDEENEHNVVDDVIQPEPNVNLRGNEKRNHIANTLP